jgi:hypothetical protein
MIALFTQVSGEPGPGQHLREILAIADGFTGLLANKQQRDEIGSLQSPTVAQENATFSEMREFSSRLQEHLEGLFLDTAAIGKLGRKYLTF